MSHPSILVAVEPTLYRTGLISLLNQQWPAFQLVVTTDAGQIVGLIKSQSFQLLILDDQLPSSNPSTLLHCLYQCYPTQKILRLADSPPSNYTSSQCIISRQTAPSHLAAILKSLLTHEPLYNSKSYNSRSIPTRFSARELEVLHLVIADHCNQEIANQLYVSVRTVESHRRALLQKSGARTLAGLVAWVLREGIVA